MTQLDDGPDDAPREETAPAPKTTSDETAEPAIAVDETPPDVAVEVTEPESANDELSAPVPDLTSDTTPADTDSTDTAPDEAAPPLGDGDVVVDDPAGFSGGLTQTPPTFLAPADPDDLSDDGPSDVGGDDGPPDDSASGSTPGGGGPASQRGIIIGAIFAVIAVAVIGFVLGNRSSGSGTSTTAPPTSAASTESSSTTDSGTPTPPRDAVKFSDPVSGVSISYPKEWARLEPSGTDPTVVLILSAGGQDSVLVRSVVLKDAVDASNIADINSFTDGIVGSTGLTPLKEQQIELNGMPGYYYLYLFTDPVTGQQGVHAHYFLFQGRVMTIVVLQAVPTTQFDVLAKDFDAVASSLVVTPTNPPPATDPATTTTSS